MLVKYGIINGCGNYIFLLISTYGQNIIYLSNSYPNNDNTLCFDNK